jgi:hypothetical protein
MVAYGSLDNPVKLSPFQEIVNVHWVSPYLLVTYGIKLTYTPVGQTGTGPGPAFVEPFSEGYVTEATPSFSPSEHTIKRWDGSGFVTVNEGEVALSGEPTPPGAFSYSAWEINGIDSAVEGGSKGPVIQILPQSGPHPDINLPVASSFFTDLTVDGEVKGQNFVSGPEPAPFAGTVPLWATYDPELVQKDTFSIDASTLSAVWKEKTYTPIATQTSQTTFAVLLKRQTSTS